jgi:glutamate synthase domain-containing protein 3
MLDHLLSVKLNAVLDRLPPPRKAENGMVRVTIGEAGRLERPLHAGQVLAVDARGFKPEGIDPLKVLGCFLDYAHQLGWRRYIVYRTEGQRGIGMGIGSGPTPETEFDVYGSPGEYCGAFNMGALIRVHSHCQNFTGMVMHSGELQIHGDVGKVTGYAAKGGTFNILGNVVDRGWVNAVSDPRSQGLEVNIVGTAFEHLCQALMGGSVIMLGLARGADGALQRLPSPYSGSKILAGASAGEVIFYDPSGRLEEAQYRGGAARPVEGKKWEEIVSRLLRLESIFGLGFSKDGKNQLRATIDGQAVTIGSEAFRWIIPAGGLEGYH